VPTDPSRIELGYLSEQTDVERLVEGLDRAETLAAESSIRALCGNSQSDLDRLPRNRRERRDWVRRNCWSYHHASGTCAMGPASDRASVVDAHGRVHGIEGERLGAKAVTDGAKARAAAGPVEVRVLLGA
jgi:choline dehydrogenase